MKRIGHSKRNRKEIKHGGLDHLELLQQREHAYKEPGSRIACSMREVRDSDPYAENNSRVAALAMDFRDFTLC